MIDTLDEKVKYVGFELEKVPDFLKEVHQLEYNVSRTYEETSYKSYRYINVRDIDILITPCGRLDELSDRYRKASPIFTYMKPESRDDLEKYALFLRMINETRADDIIAIEKEQETFEKTVPFNIRYTNAYKWQIYYSQAANRFFMLASTNEEDNSAMFYLLKRKIEQNKREKKLKDKFKDEDKDFVYVPVCNVEYEESVLKKGEISDLENYLWFFTREWPNTYEFKGKDGCVNTNLVGNTVVFDRMESMYKISVSNREEALKTYKLIKALFIISYDTEELYKFSPKINEEGSIDLYYGKENITYDFLPDFLKREAINRNRENENIKQETKELKEDLRQLKRLEAEKIKEYHDKEKEIVQFLECRKTFFGKLKFFFGKKKKKPEVDDKQNSMDKDRLRQMLSEDKNRYSDVSELSAKPYTVEDIVNICKELKESINANENAKLDKKAMSLKNENLDRKIKNANQYIEEIDKHRKSIFYFWKFANKDEVKALAEGDIEETEKRKLAKTFDFDKDMEKLANDMDRAQREKLSHKEQNAVFASSFVLDGINLASKEKLLKEDKVKIANILKALKIEYEAQIDTIKEKDFDIFGNISEDSTKIKVLKNNKHRENEKDKFKVLNLNLSTQENDFIESLKDIGRTLKNESNKIACPCDITIYKASLNKIDGDGFDKFDINPNETLNKLEENEDGGAYLYKINVPENTNLIFYSNIMFFENDNKTLPLGMDISQEILIDLDLYELKLIDNHEININVFKNDYETYVRKINVYEYDLQNKKMKKEKVEKTEKTEKEEKTEKVDKEEREDKKDKKESKEKHELDKEEKEEKKKNKEDNKEKESNKEEKVEAKDVDAIEEKVSMEDL